MAPGSQKGLFGSCGVRGVVGETITPELVDRLGRAFATHVGPDRRVCVGRDTRRSGPELERMLVAQLVAGGVSVTHLGVISTPGLYFMTRELGFDAGVQITASHNPPEYNGFKFCDAAGMLADQDAIEAAFDDPPPTRPTPAGHEEALDGAAGYFRRMAELCPRPLQPLKLVVDCAGGPDSAHLPALLRSHGHEVIEHNCVPDVEQCDRDPEPRPSTLGNTIALLHETGADGGLCSDGDNDRLVFLDRQGFLGFQLGNAAVATVVLEASASRLVIGTVETGRFVEEAVRRAGGTMQRTVVGDVKVARVVHRTGAAAGVEECGHYVLPEVGFFSSTVYPALLLLARRDLNALRQDMASLPPVYALEQRLNCPEDRKPEVMDRVAAHITALVGEGSFTDVDGVRVDWQDGWLLVRPSGTSPYMKVNAEAFREERAREMADIGTRLVEEALA